MYFWGVYAGASDVEGQVLCWLDVMHLQEKTA